MTDGRTLGILGALGGALFNVGLDHFPRPAAGGAGDGSSAETIVPDLAAAMGGWGLLPGAADCDVDEALDFARASLAEVKSATEYQDGKASRLLTVTSFVSALAGFLFNTFWAGYPLASLHPRADAWHLLPAAAYALFLLFVLFALGGAVVTFHATRTRFKFPAGPKAGNDGGPASRLFHGGIVAVPPEVWVRSFVSDAGGRAAFRDLKLAYLRDYVGETYLVAAKTADKLRYLQPAQSMLSTALRCLLLFTLAFAATLVLLPPTRPAARPTTVVLDQSGGPARVVVQPPAVR